MSIIKCPECGKEISDRSDACIHCGYPLKLDKKICCFEGVDYDLTEWEERLLSCYRDNSDEVVQQRKLLFNEVANKTGLKPVFVMLIAVEANKLGHIPATYNRSDGRPASPVPTCPKCRSTSITTGPRGVNGIWGFIGASKTVNRCSNCGHTWEPRKR